MGALGHLAPLPSFAPAGEPATPGRSALPCFVAESARAGTLMSLSEGAALSRNFNPPIWRSQQKTEKATAALPLQFVMSVSRTQALHILSRGAKCLTYEAEGRCPPS